MNGCVDIVEYLIKEHGVSLNTAAIPVGDVPLLTDTLVSEHVNISITVYGKTFSGENFHGFDDFHSIANLFLLIMALLIGNIRMSTSKLLQKFSHK